MSTFSFRTRNQNIKKLQEETFDLLIIGGGINGAGAARDATLRGLKVALIDANDFSSGTSSRSSKLIHGGIRYLENREFKLVFEALSERAKLFEMAPHLVHPLRFMIPLYKSSRVGMGIMSLGMWLYDALSLFQAPEMHERLSAKESQNRVPAIAEKDLLGSFVYSDAYMDDDRLVLETLRSANKSGAVIANYISAEKPNFSKDGKIESVACRNQLANSPPIVIKAQHIISCVGPWTDLLGEKLFNDWKKILRPTKGVHLTFSRDRVPLSCAVVMGAEKSSRIVFAIPRHEMVIIGTTDTDFQENPESVVTEKEDVNYLLQVANQYFPGLHLIENDILSCYAGVRPLVKDESENEGKTSREHVIFNDSRGITFVAGGKYTTYRLIAEQAVDKALENFSFDRKINLKKAPTTMPLNEMTSVDLCQRAIGQVQQWSNDFKMTENDVLKLCERYGYEAHSILKNNMNQWGYWKLEAQQAIETTMCLTLTDFYTRRVPLFLATSDHGVSLLPEISSVFAQKLGWSADEQKEQEEKLGNYIDRELSWRS